MPTSRSRAICLILVFLLAGCAPQRFFYYPNRRLYADPDKMGVPAELVSYDSLSGTKIYGLIFKTPRRPKGIVVHFHGNFGNMSNHFPGALFLLDQGFDLLEFDYGGYGASPGKPSPERTVLDGQASVRYAKERLRGGGGVGVFGQSLGAAVAAVVAAREPDVKAVVLEAGFTSYRSMGSAAMRRSLLTWPFSFIFPPIFLRRGHDPAACIDEISPRPVFIIHGDEDEIVPVRMSKELYEKAKDPKSLWIVPQGRHLRLKEAAGAEYEKRIALFFTDALSQR